MNVLVINCGSSSLKYQLIETDSETVLAKGLCERIGIDGSAITHTPKGGDKVTTTVPMKDHTDAVKLVIEKLTDTNVGVIKSLDEIDAVGHRVVHGGEKFASSVVINDEVMAAIAECNDLAPLHNPANIIGINACKEVMPGVPMVAVFDTGWGMAMEKSHYMYALPYEAYENYKVRRYGFHGTSHRYVTGRALELLGNPNAKVITCHLGNGSSVSCSKAGKCVDTSMGLTPLEGLPMGTRCGSIDPAIMPFLMDKTGMTAKEMDTYMNKKSGMLGISGISSDFRDLGAAAEKGDERAKLALDMFVYAVKKYIGSYAAALNGADAIVFTAGVGENDREVRADILRDMEYMGIVADFDYNMTCPRGEEVCISKPESKVKIFVIPTDEEMTIARDTARLVAK